ncbi:MAG: thiamine ABC transporter substrate-binding protein [Candidatus Heimdallarchaeota archaeon]|nr:thiamine ABC transporter substrate-binding protein [Candidatus Heimdallarchaeota archaeon]
MKRAHIQTYLVILMLIMLPINCSIIGSQRSFNIDINSYPVRITVFNPNAEDELVIYTHDSFLVWGLDPETTRQIAFTKFGVENSISVKLIEFGGMVDALNTLITQKDNPQADIVIGLDNVMVSRAKEENILQKYPEVDLSKINTSLVSALDPDKYLLPIDFGLIAIIFDTEYINTTSYPELNQLTFDDLATTFVNDFVVQDPTLSSTGINFLLYQIAFYEQILKQDWMIWWQSVKKEITIDESWSDSWDRVFSTKEAHMMVSYGTDPAYNAYFNYSEEKNAVIFEHNSEKYGWMQIEGIGIINGTSKKDIAEKFVDYALNDTFQDLIALNNWMFPANQEVILPDDYINFAITTENTTVLNYQISSEYINENYLTWLNEWEQLIYGTGYWWIWVLIPSLIIIAGLIIASYVYFRKKRLDIE